MRPRLIRRPREHGQCQPQLSQSVVVISDTHLVQPGFPRSVVRLNAKTVPLTVDYLPRRRLLSYGVLGAGALLLPAGNATSQTIEGRHWQGATAITRQPEQVVAGTIAEWRSLWGRVGSPAPDVFEPGRMNAVGIFLGRRAGEGYSVNILSTSRRRDRIVVVFEERMPAEFMMAQRAPAPSSPRPVAIAPARRAASRVVPAQALRRPARAPTWHLPRRPRPVRSASRPHRGRSS